LLCVVGVDRQSPRVWMGDGGGDRGVPPGGVLY